MPNFGNVGRELALEINEEPEETEEESQLVSPTLSYYQLICSQYAIAFCWKTSRLSYQFRHLLVAFSRERPRQRRPPASSWLKGILSVPRRKAGGFSFGVHFPIIGNSKTVFYHGLLHCRPHVALAFCDGGGMRGPDESKAALRMLLRFKRKLEEFWFGDASPGCAQLFSAVPFPSRKCRRKLVRASFNGSRINS
jgi:hypothetical protein